jgi:hypothetical protein
MYEDYLLLQYYHDKHQTVIIICFLFRGATCSTSRSKHYSRFLYGPTAGKKMHSGSFDGQPKN